MRTDDLIVTADVTAATVQSGEVRVNVGDAASGKGFGAACSSWGPDGFISLPNSFDASGACQVIYVQDGNEKKVVGTRDHRFHDQTGNIEAGDRAIVSSSAAKLVLKNKIGSITLATTDDGTQAGNASTIVNSPDEISLRSKHGSIIIDKDGIFLIHESGASICLGGASLPDPSNYVSISASQVYVDAGRTVIGPSSTSGGSGIFMAPVLAPVASPATGVPVTIGAGVGVVMGITASNIVFTV